MDDATSNAPPETFSLRDDVSACYSLLGEQARALLERQELHEKLSQENEELKLAVTKRMERLQGHRRERVVPDPNQLPLDFGDDPAGKDALADAVAEAEVIVQEFTVRRRIKKGCRPPRHEQFPAHIPRYEVLVDADEAEKLCPAHGPKELIGYDTTETLEFERPKLRVRVTKYPKYACPQQPACGVTQAPRPKSLVEGNRYDTSIGAEIVTAKYGYHLPFYRQ